jgi:hypothetical protein
MPKTLYQDDPIFQELHTALFTARMKVEQLEHAGFAPGVSQSSIRQMEARLFDAATSPEERPIEVGDRVTSFGHMTTIGGSPCNGEVITVEDLKTGSRLVIDWFFPHNLASHHEEIVSDGEPKYGHFNALFYFNDRGE